MPYFTATKLQVLVEGSQYLVKSTKKTDKNV